MIGGERAPTDDFVVLQRDCYWMFRAMMLEPFLPALEWLWFLLIGAGGMEDIVVVDIVDGFQIGFRGQANRDRRWRGFQKRFAAL